jgi:hypothetical protein
MVTTNSTLVPDCPIHLRQRPCRLHQLQLHVTPKQEPLHQQEAGQHIPSALQKVPLASPHPAWGNPPMPGTTNPRTPYPHILPHQASALNQHQTGLPQHRDPGSQSSSPPPVTWPSHNSPQPLQHIPLAHTMGPLSATSKQSVL